MAPTFAPTASLISAFASNSPERPDLVNSGVQKRGRQAKENDAVDGFDRRRAVASGLPGRRRRDHEVRIEDE